MNIMALVLVRVENGKVLTDTHNCFGTKMVADTEITRKMYPDSIPVNGNLVLRTGESVFTAPVSGLYEVTAGVIDPYYTCNMYYMEKGEKKYFRREDGGEGHYLHITMVRT
jgi:hypothetical protein